MEALSGIRYLEFGEMIVGPWAGLMLALFGAEVIKIESGYRLDMTRRAGVTADGGRVATYIPGQRIPEGMLTDTPVFNWVNLNKKGMSVEDAKTEIEMGISAVRLAVGKSTSPFFRFPALQHPPELVTYLGERNIAIFSTDLDSFDFKIRKPDQIMKSVLDKLKK